MDFDLKTMLIMTIVLAIAKMFTYVPWWVVFFPLWFPVSLFFLLSFFYMLANKNE